MCADRSVSARVVDSRYVDEVEILNGGAVNAGRVVRLGDVIRRPVPSNASTLHSLLRHFRSVAFDGAPLPVGVDGDTEIMEFVDGDVAVAPYPAWANTESALTTVAMLLRRLHDASVSWRVPVDAAWSTALADPEGGAVICHNDVCLENVVFRRGSAAALIDFDFAAPGRRVWDVVMTARYWVPVTDPDLPTATARGLRDPIARLRAFIDAYGLEDSDRRSVVEVLLQAEDVSRRFVEAEASRGAPAFIAMWDEDARRRFERKVDWIHRNAATITEALVHTQSTESTPSL
ncbi:aminoglycoside phosphotransferase family protein [Microbacterium sp. ProA8]|uniref:aminoglycoside phosphotransferase family protein n=1 Tax=Microbacterium chionoecetis TaxID=3153754 RepID=UPI0032630A1F